MSKAKIYYHNIGDYLNREEKLGIIKKFGSVANPEMDWKQLEPNEHGDWISQRNDIFDSFIPMGDKDDGNTIWVKGIYCRGLETARDSWVYQSNLKKLDELIRKSTVFFNEECKRFWSARNETKNLDAKNFISYDYTKISWSRAFITDVNNQRIKYFDSKNIVESIYRPFFKQHLYFSREQNNVVSRMDSFFPNPSLTNLVICVSANYKDGSVLIANCIPDLHFNGDTQCFPLYYYEERQKQSPTLFEAVGDSEYIRKDGVSDFILERAKAMYGNTVGKEDIFYYVYGFLHSPEYREKFANDLKKMLPRLPLVEDVRDFWKFSKAGRQLADLHVNYEKVPAFSGVKVVHSPGDSKSPGEYLVSKMRFPKKDQKETIIYNSRITIENIPAKAYEYIVNGKSAIEWIMERYQITIHKESQIKNDPNDWAIEVGNPRYILDLLLSIINVSVLTVGIVEGLPEVKFD